MKVNRKFCTLLLGSLFCAIALPFLLPLLNTEKLSVLFSRSGLTHYFQTAGSNSIYLFVGAHMIANAIGVPGTLLVVVGGAVYGLWWGTLWSVIGATLGAIAAFLLARYLFYDWFKQRFHHNPILKRINTALCANGLRCVLTIRFSPVSPFNVVNFAFGLTPVTLRAYAMGTLVGIIPGTLAYTSLGVTGAQALTGSSFIPLILCLFGLMGLSALPWLLQLLPRRPK